MPTFGPVSRKDLIKHLRHIGFEGPFSGGKHQFMVKDQITVRIPNPHGKDISIGLLSRILKQAGVTREEWDNLIG